jgi:cation diffusion facilitator family transporter
MAGSAALLADALHSGADVAATAVTMGAVKISSRPADENHPYGYGGIQFISSAIVGLVLLFGALYLIYESLTQITAGDFAAPNPVALLGALVAIGVNELMYRYQSCVGKENNSPAILANAWDNRSDALSSLGVLIGIVVSVTLFPMADLFAAVAVGVLVGKIGVELNIEAVKGLMDTSIDLEVVKEVYKVATDTPGVEAVSYVRGRAVGEEVHIETKLFVDGKISVVKSDLIADAVKRGIRNAVEHAVDITVAVAPVPSEHKRSRRRLIKVGGL